MRARGGCSRNAADGRRQRSDGVVRRSARERGLRDHSGRGRGVQHLRQRQRACGAGAFGQCPHVGEAGAAGGELPACGRGDRSGCGHDGVAGPQPGSVLRRSVRDHRASGGGGSERDAAPRNSRRDDRQPHLHGVGSALLHALPAGGACGLLPQQLRHCQRRDGLRLPHDIRDGALRDLLQPGEYGECSAGRAAGVHLQPGPDDPGGSEHHGEGAGQAGGVARYLRGVGQDLLGLQPGGERSSGEPHQLHGVHPRGHRLQLGRSLHGSHDVPPLHDDRGDGVASDPPEHHADARSDAGRRLVAGGSALQRSRACVFGRACGVRDLRGHEGGGWNGGVRRTGREADLPSEERQDVHLRVRRQSVREHARCCRVLRHWLLVLVHSGRHGGT